jgi:hypothetical protein
MSDLTWRKSTYSGTAEGSACVELAWRKSTYSGTAEGGECVELAAQGAVRDSKNPVGPVLSVDVTALVAAVKAGQITLR